MGCLPAATEKELAMFKPDPGQSYMMPAHFGPRYIGEKTSGWYRDVTVMAVSYVTDAQRLAEFLPEPFQVGEEALLTVYFACNKQVDWLAGHGYNMLGVNASVVYKGKKEEMTGSFALVIWENLADPILSGRELQGIPKIYADIPDHSIHGGDWRCNASHFGHKIVELSIGDLSDVPMEDIEAELQEKKGLDHPMGWRYMPELGGFGTAAIDQPTTYPSESVYTSAMVGEGLVSWQQLTWEQNPTQYHIVNALQSLPVLEYRPAVITRGSTNLVLPDRWTRSLA